MPVKIAPSILSANFAQLEQEIARVATADMLHIDVMDGHFVPNITIGPLVVRDIKPKTQLPLDVHLMISDPIKYAPEFAKAGADIITFHAEAAEPKKAVQEIKTLGTKVGVSIKPNTSLDEIIEIIDDVDMVLIMTVEPGFGGQTFMHDCLSKVEKLHAQWKGDIQVDGGINTETAPIAYKSGANILVAGSAVYKENPEQQIKKLREACQ